MDGIRQATPDKPDAPTKTDTLGNRLYVWGTILGMVVGTNIGALYIGKYWGQNETVINLPTRVDDLQKEINQRLTDAQTRDTEAFQTQLLINQKLLDALSELRKDLVVNETRDASQQEALVRIERAMEYLRDLINKKP